MVTDLAPEEIKEKVRMINGNTEILEMLITKKSNGEKDNETRYVPTKSLRITFTWKNNNRTTSYQVH